MPYTVKQLAKLAGVTARTLHHYDAVGLLRPGRVERNGYRQYGETELLRLQQILFFRELDFPLDEIKRILESPNFDMAAALRDHRKMIEIKKKRLTGLIATIDKTIAKLTEKKPMPDKELYEEFDEETQRQYEEEAKKRWGHTDAWKQSQERTKNFTKADWDKLKADGDRFMKLLAATAPKGAKSPEFQELIDQQYNNLRRFYEPNLEMFRGLARMYVDDPRFTKTYEKYAPGLTQVVSEAMLYYADVKEGKAA